MLPAALSATASATELEADFHFNGTRTAPTGETIVDIGEGNGFAAETVDGAAAARQVLAFPLGNGLSLPTSGLAGSGSYSVVALFRQEAPADGRLKLLDFAGGTSDSGLYLCDGKLLIELAAGSPCPDGIATETAWKQVVLTRDTATGEVRAYLGSDQQSATDSLGALALGSELQFFRDDGADSADEHSGGAVARIRVYDGALSPAEVDALDRVDGSAPAVGFGAVSAVTADSTPALFGSAGSAAGDLAPVTVKVYGGSSVTDTPVRTLSAVRSGTGWSANVSPALADGTYTAQAEQADGAGNTGVSQARTFAVDTTPAAVSLDAPWGETSDRTPAYSGAAGNAPGDAETVTVNVYSGETAGGTLVQTLSATRSASRWSVEGSPPLADGVYTARAEQADAAGNTGHSTATTFTVDGAGPAVSLETPGPGSATNDNTPTYSGAAGAQAGDLATVTIRVYAGPSASGSPHQTLTATRAGDSWSKTGTAPLADGTYTAQAAQSDSAGNVNVSEAGTFVIDTAKPETNIASAPADLTSDSTPGFAFSSPDATKFVCRLYPAGMASAPPFVDCASPRTTEPLADGSYIFQVAAVDAAGNQDESPGSRAFRVDTAAPRATIQVAAGDTTASSATFVFAANEAASFRCRIDGGAWEPCSSPRSFTGLSLGPHTFEVTASDAAGNRGSVARHDWQVLRPGARIPAASLQAVTLAQEMIAVRRALGRIPLRRASRRGTITVRGVDTLTPGSLRLLARARGRRFALAERDVSAAGSYPLKLKLTKRGRVLARRAPKLRVDLTLSFVDTVGRALTARTQAIMFSRGSPAG